MTKDCLYCGMQFADTTHFCPNCGRPTESGFSFRPIEESELELLRRQVRENNDLIRHLIRTLRNEASHITTRSTGLPHLRSSDKRRAEARVLASELS